MNCENSDTLVKMVKMLALIVEMGMIQLAIYGFELVVVRCLLNFF